MVPRIPPEEGSRRHGVEVLGGVARSLAHPVATFYRALREDEGLSEADARALAGEFLRQLLSDARRALGE